MQKIICFSGQLRSGKDTASDYLYDRLMEDYRKANCHLMEPIWYRGSFGFRLKKVFVDNFGVDLDFIEEWKTNNEPPQNWDLDIRRSLQFIGDGFRKIKSSVWVDLFFKDFPTENVIISDGRYYSEVDEVRRRNGINVAMWRPGFENDIPHPSEAELKSEIQKLVDTGLRNEPVDVEGSPFDWFLVNDTGVDDLYKNIDNLLLPFINKFYQVSS